MSRIKRELEEWMEEDALEQAKELEAEERAQGTFLTDEEKYGDIDSEIPVSECPDVKRISKKKGEPSAPRF
jgi:hypothetical protein